MIFIDQNMDGIMSEFTYKIMKWIMKWIMKLIIILNEERIKKGLEPDHIDKEFIRKWVKKEYGDPYSVSSIKIPKEMCNKLSNKYLLLRELITED